MIDSIEIEEKRDVFFAKNNKNIKDIPSHFMVYLEPYLEDKRLFVGAMLTHFPKNPNIKIKKDHFLGFSKPGKRYKFSYDETYIVNQPLFKKKEWMPFVKVGKLSEESIRFVEQIFASKAPEFFPFNK